MEKRENMLTAIVSILLGLLLITLKGQVISIALTILGGAILLWAVIDFVNQMTSSGIVKSVIGICVLVFGWMFVNLALYILAAAIIIMGLLQIVNLHKICPINLTITQKILFYAKPAVIVLAGGCLLLNQGGTIDWVFIITGVLLIVEGVFALFELR